MRVMGSSSGWAEAFGADPAGIVAEADQEGCGGLDEAGGTADVDGGLEVRRPAPGDKVLRGEPAGRARGAGRRGPRVKERRVQARHAALQLLRVEAVLG